MIRHLPRTLLALTLAVGVAAASTTPARGASSDPWSMLPIEAAHRSVDEARGTVDHVGEAVIDLGVLRVEAERITEHREGGVVARLSASGDPLTFDVPGQARGQAREMVLDVLQRRLVVHEYTITDHEGNRMRGRKATFSFAP